MSTTMSVTDQTDDTWDAALSNVSAEEQQLISLKEDFKKIIEEAQGVQPYLIRFFGDAKAKQEFLEALKSMLPLSTQTTYTTMGPVVPGGVVTLTLDQFAFQAGSSLQLPPEVHKSSDLINRFVVEGFLSEDEPVLIRPPCEGEIGKFSVEYIKGQSRVHTLMAFAVYCFTHGEALPMVIKTSAAAILCKCPENIQNAQDELFFAMRTAHRSAIRKAPHIMNWVWSLQQLQKRTGLMPLQVVTEWNRSVPQCDQITGQMSKGTRNVLSMPTACVTKALQIVSVQSWEKCPFSNDNLSSKKLSVGASFKGARVSTTSIWSKWGVVTQDSLVLMMDNLAAKQKAPNHKPTKTELEGALEQCTLACHVKDATLSMLPGLGSILDTFINKLARGCPMLEMEMESQLMNKSDTVNVRDFPSIAHLLNSAATTPENVSAMEEALRSTQDMIDKDRFGLFVKEVTFDAKSCRVYYANILEHVRGTAAERDEWKTKVRTDNRSQCRQFWSKIHISDVLSPDDAARTSSMIATWASAKKMWCTKLRIESDTVIPVLIVNFSAPSLVPSAAQSSIIQAMNFILAESPHAIGVVLMPTHAWKKGQVWMVDQAITKTLVHQGGCHVDKEFTVVFNDRSDVRDDRPLTYPGRIVWSNSMTGPSDIWKKSSLMNDGLVGPVKQFKRVDMEMIQELDPLSLPKDINMPQGANKYAQVGPDAWAAILKALTDGVPLSSRHSLICVDLTANWTQFGKAFVKFNATNLVPSLLLNYHLSVDNKDWYENEMVEVLVDLASTDAVKVPGVVSNENAASNPEKPEPARPSLKTGVWLNPKEGSNLPGATIASELWKVWGTHPEFGKDFELACAKFDEEFAVHGVPLNAAAAAAVDTAAPPVKKAKVAADVPSVDIASLPESITEVKLLSVKMPKDLLVLAKRSGGVFSISNPSEDHGCIPKGSMLLGFGKINFRQLKNDSTEFDPQLDFMFAPDNSEYEVALESLELKTLKELVSKQADTKTKADAKICYHDFEDVPGDTAAFKLLRKIDVVCRCKEDKQQGAVTPGSFGYLSSFAMWNTSWTKVVWVCKWSSNGLTPIRPVVITTATVDIAPGKGIIIK